ncbi:MAG TPA: hypothetical protein VNJ02_19525 [Vicinamibacterales bacterium]|nr:hypothetical protein [Vicinamibacterales bacterium]
MTIIPVTAADLLALRDLLRRYEQWVWMDLTFQQFDAEVASLPCAYAPPDGALLIARIDGEPARIVALLRVGDSGHPLYGAHAVSSRVSGIM